MSPASRLALAFVLCLGGTAARAEEPHATCYVRMIQASHEGSGIDPKITRLRPYLEQAPFTAWKKFTLLDEKDMTLAPASTDKFTLPNGKQASLTYVDHVFTADKKHRLRLRLEVTDPAKEGGKKILNTTFVLDEGGVVLQAGWKHQNMLLILGFSCDIPND
jgi:hypothetical protein